MGLTFLASGGTTSAGSGTAAAPTIAWASNMLAGLGNRAIAPVAVVISGSSTVKGFVSTASTRRATDRLEKRLQAQLNPAGVLGGRHVRLGDTGWAATGQSNTAAYSGFGRESYSLANAGTLTAGNSVTMRTCTLVKRAAT